MILFGWHVWRGESGRRYRFKISLTKGNLPEVGGIYVFVKRSFVFFLHPLYVGKAANLRSRLLGHEKWDRAFWRLGATERHFMRVAEEDTRQAIEEDIVRRYKPVMNTVLVPKSENDAAHNAPPPRWWWLRNWVLLKARS